MTEADLIAWFAAHPFIKAQVLAAVVGLAPMVVHDYQTFKNFQAADPNGEQIAFDPFVAMRRYAKAIVIAVLPVYGVAIYRILGL